jgi:hypothetical protein
MATVQTASFYDFQEAFRRMGRENQYTYAGLRGLFEYLDELSEDMGEPIELDVISLCCDYSEETFEDVARNYKIDLSECEDDDEDAIRETVLDYLNDHTVVAWSDDDTVVYAAF